MCMYWYVLWYVLFLDVKLADLGRLPLIPAGDTGTVPHSMHGVMPASYPGGECDKKDQPGTGSALFYINSWAMVFPSDHPAD